MNETNVLHLKGNALIAERPIEGVTREHFERHVVGCGVTPRTARILAEQLGLPLQREDAPCWSPS